MADDKSGRDKQAHDEKRRQQQRAILEAVERSDETEPPIDEAQLDEFEAELDALEFPATGTEIVEAIGDRPVESVDGTEPVAALVPHTDVEQFDSPVAVRLRIQRPTIAAAMKQVVEATETHQQTDLGRSQREVYEKTFRALRAIDADDDDEGIRVVADWIVEQIHEKGALPGSRAVRRKAAEFCRSNGYPIRNDEWLGV